MTARRYRLTLTAGEINELRRVAAHAVDSGEIGVAKVLRSAIAKIDAAEIVTADDGIISRLTNKPQSSKV